MTSYTTGTPKSDASSDDMARQIDVLRADFAKLTASLSADMADGLDAAGRRIDRTSRAAKDKATEAVTDNPLMALGIAVGVGLLLGLFARR